LLITAISLLFFFTNDFIANEMMAAWEPDAIEYNDLTRKYELGIVLSGVTVAEQTPDDRVYFQKGADRVVHAVQLYKLGIVKKLLVSGGSGRLVEIGERESDDIKLAMILMGVPEEDIQVENESRNTHESALAVKEILKHDGFESSNCMLITSAFHMPRSIACFRKVNLDMDTFTTDFYTHPRKFYPDTLFIPKAEAMMVWTKLIREWVGYVAYKIVGYV
jgi:uncharacterized SAM-binding protein YcdF (DUF218 family)